jgi:hypothetical protein
MDVIMRALNPQVAGQRRYAVEGDEDTANVKQHSADSAHEYAG